MNLSHTATQMLPCPQAPAPKLTLIHGWGANARVWRDWAKTYLQPHFEIHLLELPGFGDQPSVADSTDWLETLAAELPETTHVLGWSLGGLMAQQLATHYPQKILSVINLASSPCFMQLEDWPHAIAPEQLQGFIEALEQDPNKLLNQFWRLQLQGSENARTLMKQLNQQMKNDPLPSQAGLAQGLTLLKELDLRHQLCELPATLWLLGEQDPLVPAALAEFLCSSTPDSAHCQIISGAAHMPFFSHPEATAQAVCQFIEAQ